jgi:hypothetical protein
MRDGIKPTRRFNIGDIVEVNEIGRESPYLIMILDVCHPDNSDAFYLVILPSGVQVWYWENELIPLEDA